MRVRTVPHDEGDNALDAATQAGYYGKAAVAPAPTLMIEDNPEVGRLLGPDGRLAKIVRAKPERSAGFRLGGA